MTSIKVRIGELLEKKMDRATFLKQVGVGVVAISGAGAAVRSLAPQENRVTIASAYGTGAYGGMNDGKKLG